MCIWHIWIWLQKFFRDTRAHRCKFITRSTSSTNTLLTNYKLLFSNLYNKTCIRNSPSNLVKYLFVSWLKQTGMKRITSRYETFPITDTLKLTFSYPYITNSAHLVTSGVMVLHWHANRPIITTVILSHVCFFRNAYWQRKFLLLLFLLLLLIFIILYSITFLLYFCFLLFTAQRVIVLLNQYDDDDDRFSLTTDVVHLIHAWVI